MATSQDILRTYSPEEVIVVLSNDDFSYAVSGYADGTFITISRQVPHATLYTGGDSTSVRVVRKNTSSTVTITLAAASEGNDVLTELFRQDVLQPDGTKCFSILVKDGLGRSLFSSTNAFIGTTPDESYATEEQTKAWVISCITAEHSLGGSGYVSPDTVDAIEDIGGSVDSRWIQSQA